MTPVDEYLRAQATLTAVERFAQRHEAELVPRQARYYRDLVPLAVPGPGEQYGFEVDLDACTGCKACVTACHRLNGLDENESWRSVGVLLGGTASASFQQTVTTACHHCVEPACLAGCPVDAYEKDPVTGIVVHLDDQCIGCSYCTLTCPYEVPSFNAARGIVRKCDMCRGRLEAGEAPACVQACPNGAISIAVVDVQAARDDAQLGALVPGAPPSSVTVPTTRYRTTRVLPHDAGPANRHAVRPAHGHPPLVVMLVLTQWSVGAFVADLWLHGDDAHAVNAVVAAAAGLLALAASVLHLGRPRYAYRAVIGLRHSWLSREVVAFGAFAALAVPYAVATSAARPVPLLGALVAATGVAGVVCSALVYAATMRPWWRARRTFPAFAATTASCGLATALCMSPASGIASLLAAVTTAALAGEASILLRLRWKGSDDGRAATALLLWRDLRHVAVARAVLGATGGVAIPLVVGYGSGPPWLAAVGLVLVLAGELLSRSLYFRASVSPRMPGPAA